MIASNSSMTAVSGSFRDPCGRVFRDADHAVRTIESVYAPHWEAMESGGFLQKMIASGLLLECAEIAPVDGSWKSIQSPLLPFVSYPYEWSFSQLKDAALHTLKVMELALAHGLILKDASAYNIQFIDVQPIFIDHLSFEIRDPSAPWVAYLQFCKHFLAPLALMSKVDLGCGKFSSLWIDGIPLNLASSLLPFNTKISPLLQIHIHAHARMQKRYSDARKSMDKARNLKLRESTVPKLCESLRLCVEGLSLPEQKTEWGDYYQDTNYTEQSAEDKADFVRRTAAGHSGKLAVDLGANTGLYSRLLTKSYSHVLAADIDYQAVDKHYRFLKNETFRNITPLVLDLANPSPGIGWAEKERESFSDRCNADMITGLALIHHLVFGAGIPLEKTAEYFHSLLKTEGLLVLEFVPIEDSQVRRLLAVRENVFADYTLQGCIAAYAPYFELKGQHSVRDSLRTLLVFSKRELENKGIFPCSPPPWKNAPQPTASRLSTPTCRNAWR